MSISDREYNALRGEILKLFEISSNNKLAAVTATGAILAFAVSKSNPWLYLVPFAIIIPFAINQAFRAEAVIRIGTYIKILGEEATGQLGWECRHPLCMSILPGFRYHAIIGRASQSSTYAMLGLVCLGLFLGERHQFRWKEALVSSVVVAMLALLELRLVAAGRQASAYVKAWRRILAEETRSSSSQAGGESGFQTEQEV